MKALLRFIDKGLFRATWRLARSRVLHRIRTAVFLNDPNYDFYFDRVDEALELIARYDPKTMEEIQRHFDGILVLGSERFRLGHWNDNAKLCVITGPHLASSASSPELVALTLVHENMHARLCAAGISYRDGRRAPVEVICAMAELAFARRIPHSVELVERAERRLDNAARSVEERWSNETQRGAVLEHLRTLGSPIWFVKLVGWLSRVFHRAA